MGQLMGKKQNQFRLSGELFPLTFHPKMMPVPVPAKLIKFLNCL